MSSDDERGPGPLGVIYLGIACWSLPAMTTDHRLYPRAIRGLIESALKASLKTNRKITSD
jgi:hypothetical protein